MGWAGRGPLEGCPQGPACNLGPSQTVRTFLGWAGGTARLFLNQLFCPVTPHRPQLPWPLFLLLGWTSPTFYRPLIGVPWPPVSSGGDRLSGPCAGFAGCSAELVAGLVPETFME